MYRMQSALDARHRGQLAGLFTDLPPRRPGLLARVKAILRGEPPPGQDQPDGLPPGTRRIREMPGPGPQGLPWARSGPKSPAAPRPLVPPPSPPRAAPLFFPPGSGTRFTIGRTRECDLCLSDLSVSRMHALLVRREDGWVLSDLGSHNGTRLNGWLVREPVPVRPGDRVEFGSMAFIVQGDPPGELAPEQAAEDQPPGPGDSAAPGTSG